MIPKVSIIVPVYNVEKILVRCIESIINQTYKNIEIILVDDGSTDKSPYICDRYLSDNRVEVFHKPNSGSSDSRNLGIEKSTGDYLMFIDSDDYVSSRIVELLLSAIEYSNSDVSICAYTVITKKRTTLNTSHKKIAIDLSTADALSELMYQKSLTNSPWAKLYSKSVFGNIRYQSGKINQDLGTTYKVIANSKKITIIPEPLYYYVQRKESIINKPFSVQRMAGLQFAHEQLLFIKDIHPSILEAAENRLFTEAVSIFLKIVDSIYAKQEYKIQIDECWQIIQRYRYKILRDNQSRLQPRLSALASYFGKNIFIHIGLFVKKKIEKKI